MIDAGLAKGIRRGYMRQLRDAWESLAKRREAAKARNRYFYVDTRKAYRRSLAEARTRLGSLLGVTEIEVGTGSRSGWLAFSLFPVFDDDPLGSADELQCRAQYLLRPGGAGTVGLRLGFSGHLLDRIIQRARLITVPISERDMQAINTEFADALHYAAAAFAAIASQGDDDDRLRVMLPSQHGFFIGRYDAADHMLRMKTFVDRSKLRPAQLQALRELQAIDANRLAVFSFSNVVPGWMGAPDDSLTTDLVRIWRHLVWRDQEAKRAA